MHVYSKQIYTLSLLCISFNTVCMLQNIKDTYDILNKDYKHFSLVNGAVAYDTGVIRRLYDCGQIYPIYGKDKKGRTIITGYKNPNQTHKTVRLIHVLFYRVPGSIGEADFGTTKQLAYQDPLLIAQTIANVLALCQNIQNNDQAFENALKSLATHKNLRELAPKLIENPLLITGQNRPAWKIFIEHVALYKKKKDPDYQQQVAHVETIRQFCHDLSSIQNHLHTLLKFQALLGAEIGQVILHSLRECNTKNPDNALYPPHITQMILLAFIYKKCGHNRVILKTFYDTLNDTLNKEILVSPLDDTWVNDSFKPATQKEAFLNTRKIFLAKNFPENIDKVFAELVYYSQQIRMFPMPIGYERIAYEYAKNKKTALLPDCMCNTMRNFINIYAFDIQKNEFSDKTLQTTMGINHVYPSLKEFLEIFKSVNVASSRKAHTTWLSTISNIPYVAYNNAVNTITGESIKALETGKGYIAIPEKERTLALIDWLESNHYQIPEKDHNCYELQPSIKNIIIVLDHLLMLNLFIDAGGLAQECMRPDFIREYFPKLCAALKSLGSLSTQANIKAEIHKDFDALDYTQTPLYILFELANITCQFRTYCGHGDLKLINIQELEDKEKDFQSLLDTIPDFTSKPNLSILITNMRCRFAIQLDHLENNPELLYFNLFAAPLENADLISDLVSRLHRNMNPEMSLNSKIAIKDLLLRLIDRQPDDQQRESLALESLDLFLHVLNNQNIEQYGDIIPITNKALHASTSQDQPMQLGAVSLFKTLVQKNFTQTFEKAFQVITNTAISNNESVQISRINLLKDLLERSYQPAFEKALDTAAKETFNENKYIRENVVDLFKQLMINDPHETKIVIEKTIQQPNIKNDIKKSLSQIIQ